MNRKFAAVIAAALIVWTTDSVGAQQRTDPALRAAAEAEAAQAVSPTLTRFAGEEAFARYAAAVARRERYATWRSRRLQLAALQGGPAEQAPFCPPTDPDCLAKKDEGNIVVTGSAVRASNPSITNNQMRGVEEGDIVKQIGHSLLILQDGRIFVVDIRAGGRGRGLALTDRANVYRSADEDMWYDEMLVSGDRVLVTGYSYADEETELAIFRLGRNGRLTREGVFRISSDDYYSGSNYATRLVGDSLVVYTPLDVAEIARGGFRWPVVRRWHPQKGGASAGAPRPDGRPLLDARSIYRPVRPSEEPLVHTVSVCPLETAANRGRLECRTTAMVGPGAVTWYVTGSDAYLWTAEWAYKGQMDACAAGAAHGQASALPALLYRVPLSGAPPTVAGVRGMPPDQFAIQADSRRLHALVALSRADCFTAPQMVHLGFFTTPLARLGGTLSEVPAAVYTPVPSVPGRHVSSRFTDTHLVYGGLSAYRRGLPEVDPEDEADEWVRSAWAEPSQPAYALAIADPVKVRTLDIRHSVIRAERVGEEIVLTGYRDDDGLIVTRIGLAATARVAGQLRLDGRHESEGRSHAFNSIVKPGGGGLMALPTVRRATERGREHWRSEASDLSFISFDARGGMARAGELERRFDYVDGSGDGPANGGVAGYTCEVSCVDWYGNSRPIFTEGRIFGLSGTELIEGRMAGGVIREVQRLNIALSPPPR